MVILADIQPGTCWMAKMGPLFGGYVYVIKILDEPYDRGDGYWTVAVKQVYYHTEYKETRHVEYTGSWQLPKELKGMISITETQFEAIYNLLKISIS